MSRHLCPDKGDQSVPGKRKESSEAGSFSKALPLAPNPISLQLLTLIHDVFRMSSVMPVPPSPLLSHFLSLRLGEVWLPKGQTQCDTGWSPKTPGRGAPVLLPTARVAVHTCLCSHCLSGKGTGETPSVSWECGVPDFRNAVDEREAAPILVRVNGVKQQSCFPGR